jgi:hypothetical protein
LALIELSVTGLLTVFLTDLIGGNHYMDTAIWAAVIGAAGTIIVALIQIRRQRHTETPHPNLDRVRGAIDEPRPNSIIPRTIKCSGWARDIGLGLHLWLAVEVNDFIWPKEGELQVDRNNRWSNTVFEDGAVQEFSLCLFVANEDAHQLILDWFQTGYGTGKYGELKRIAGTRRIDRIDGLRLDKGRGE